MLHPPKTVTATKDLFRQAELRAELLIGYLRLGISVTLAAALMLSLTFSPDPVDQVVNRQVLYAVLTMAGYFALGLVCILAIRAGRFRHWMVWPSAVADCLFILFNLWLSLVNTGLTGAHMAVMPPMWLIPVVLACGVLRFNPSLQLLIVAVLVVGLIWLDRIIPDLGRGDVMARLEFFFAEPPSIMRLVMIALAGTVMVVATYRTRALFLRTLSETESRINLTRYLPPEVAPMLATSGLDALQSGTRQEMGVMFIDIRDFTARAENMAPEELMQFVSQYRRYVTEAARAHGGIIDKFMGDAVMIVFSAETRSATEAAQDAIACGQAVLTVIDEWAEREFEIIRVGVGLHWGEVFAGVVGDEDRLEYSVFGDAVNIAARLENLTKTRQVPMIASGAVLRVAGVSDAGWIGLPPAELRGRSRPLDIHGWSRTQTDK